VEVSTGAISLTLLWTDLHLTAKYGGGLG